MPGSRFWLRRVQRRSSPFAGCDEQVRVVSHRSRFALVWLGYRRCGVEQDASVALYGGAGGDWDGGRPCFLAPSAVVCRWRARCVRLSKPAWLAAL